MKSVKRASQSVLSVLAVLGTVGLASPEATAAPHDSSVKLPFGVHQTQSGRYLQDMCPVKPGTERRPHCLGKWLLPVDWKPGIALPNHSNPDKAHGGTCAAATGMGPTDVTTAYKIPSSSSSGGKIVALIDLEDSTAAADIAGYRSAEGITAIANCTALPTGSGTPCFTQVDSETGQIITDPVSVDTDADGETALDMAMVSAACPDCSIVVVGISTANANTNPVATADTGWQAFVDGVKTAKTLGASAVSISFGSFENTDPNLAADGAQAEDSGVTLLDPSGVWTQSGMPVFVASGDFAYLNENNEIDAGLVGASPSFPSSAPDVISVGGTMLINGGSAYTEAVWDDGTLTAGSQNSQDVTTSGCSTEFAMPPWQATALTGSGCSERATADVAAAAAFATGGASVGINLCDNGTMGQAEGTSAASPMVAGMFTRIGITTGLSGNLGQIYTNASGFNDLGSSTYPADTTGALGSNTDAQSCPSANKLCTVGTGWDGPSGVGTPNATALAALTWNTPLPNPDAGSSSGTTSSSSGSSSGTTSGTTSGTSNGSSNGSGTQEDSGASSSSGGNGFGSSGSGSSGCAVVSGSDDGSNMELFAGMVGVVALLGARRRKHLKK